MKQGTKPIGDLGEELAAKHLRALGFSILARNYRTRLGEIDIIAQRQGVTYFVEVKSNSREGFSAPASRVNARKRRQIANAANLWMQSQGGPVLSCFLIAEVFLDRQEIRLIREFLS